MTALSADLTTIALLQALAGLNMNEPLEHRSILDMTTKLTEAQRALLGDMLDSGAKSGNFWLDLGNPIQSLVSLERRGLVCVVEFRGAPARSSYRITDAGRAALSIPS